MGRNNRKTKQTKEEVSPELVETPELDETNDVDLQDEDAPVVDENENIETDASVEDSDVDTKVDDADSSDDTPADSDSDSEPSVPAEPVVDDVPEKSKDIISGVSEKQAEVAAFLNASDIAQLLKDGSTSVEGKLNLIMDKGVPVFKNLVAKLVAYNEKMKTGIIDEKSGAAKQYDLFHTIKSVVETDEYDLFKTKFDILNLMFMVKKDEAFNKYAIFRFDTKWTWSKKDLAALQNLSIVISELANLATRKANLKKIDISKALDRNVINLSQKGIDNIQKYYNM